MIRFEVVAFDCDGVLFDTEQANRVYYSNILQHFGRPAVTEEQFAYVHMHTISESLAYLFPDEKTSIVGACHTVFLRILGLNLQVFRSNIVGNGSTLNPYSTTLQ